MADVKESSGAAAPERGEDEAPKMFTVQLNRPVKLYGFDFLPNRDITVDQATLDLMGDAVEDAKPV